MKLYRTRTQEEYDWLMEELKAEGYEWDQGISPTEGKYTHYFNIHKNQTVIWAGEDHRGPYSITYADVDFAIEEYPNKPIIEVSELMEADPLVTKIEERNNKSYQEQLKELTEPLDLINHHKEICKKLNQLYADKNHDYGNSFGATYEKYGDISALVRISDKMNRIEQLVQTGEQKVKDEALEDSILDMANYLIMWAMELEEEK